MTALKEMTKGERLVAEILGEIPSKSELILTDKHPFLRKVIPFIESRKYWSGSATELLAAIGDNATPPNRRYIQDVVFRSNEALPHGWSFNDWIC